MVSLKFLNMRLKEMLMRSLWPSLAGTVCFSQAGKITSRPSLLCALAPLAVNLVYCRGLGMIIEACPRGSWKMICEPGEGMAT